MKAKLPTIKDDGYRFISGVKLHDEAPLTFEIPTEEEKMKIEKGHIVKLIFEIRTLNSQGEEELNRERMWVVVLENEGDWFTGILDNQSIFTDKMKPGLVMHFNWEHIVDVYTQCIDPESEKFKEYQKILNKTTIIPSSFRNLLSKMLKK